MKTDRPAPLVPNEVDLRDFPKTPIIRSRLFGSTFHAEANDSEWRAGMTLWLKSWDQSPAGSLPGDDVGLCRLAELGKDVKTWKRLRAKALHGWIESADGRLYHKVTATVVLEAWLEKLANQLSGGAGNAKRWHIDFDPVPIIEQIERARALLFAVDPQSRALRKRRPPGIPTGPGKGSEDDPSGNAGGNPDGTAAGTPNGNPDGIAIEVKGSEVKGSELQKRDSGVNQPSAPAVPASATGKGAIAKPGKVNGNGSGQQWENKAWVLATAERFDVHRHVNEAWTGFRDRVFAVVRQRTQ